MTWRLRGVWLIAVLAVDGCSAPSPSPTPVAPIPHLASIQVQSAIGGTGHSDREDVSAPINTFVRYP